MRHTIRKLYEIIEKNPRSTQPELETYTNKHVFTEWQRKILYNKLTQINHLPGT